jgi:hypothetical protein
MVFENGVKNIQAAAYNGARTVFLYFHKNLSFVIIDRAKVRSSYGPLAYFCQK